MLIHAAPITSVATEVSLMLAVSRSVRRRFTSRARSSIRDVRVTGEIYQTPSFFGRDEASFEKTMGEKIGDPHGLPKFSEQSI
ncbi:MAG: hypothetical protein C0401_07400 [Anaerolinea sp.]|nr:hypothetical protein [Anaerolinea sp.]